MSGSGRQRASDDSLAIRAAWLHFIGGLTQAKVAERLGVSNVKAHRLIVRAHEIGAVKVSVVGDIAECTALADRLTGRFDLGYCDVVPDLEEGEQPFHALGIAGARFLEREIESNRHDVIGLGHGRTLSRIVSELFCDTPHNVSFVSILGGLTRNFAANPFDVMHRIAEKTGAPSYAMPVPFFANTVEDRPVLLAQRGVREVLAMADRANLILAGIGGVTSEANLVKAQVVNEDEIGAAADEGAAGEILGHFFDLDGRIVHTPLTDRALSPSLENLKGRRIVAVAGGRQKIDAIAAVLASGSLGGLIIDETTARKVLARLDARTTTAAGNNPDATPHVPPPQTRQPAAGALS